MISQVKKNTSHSEMKQTQCLYISVLTVTSLEGDFVCSYSEWLFQQVSLFLQTC